MKGFSVRLTNLELKNPVMAASGTIGFGNEFMQFYDLSILGAIVTKGISLTPRGGNRGNRLFETEGGLINSIGLENPGLERFINNILPEVSKIDTTYIVNILGTDIEEFLTLAKRLNEIPDVDAIEVNISCPNVKAGGLSFGKDLFLTRELAKGLREIFCKPIIFKVSLDLPYLEIAAILRDEQIDAITCINTIQAVVIDRTKKRFFFENIYGGLSGPAIRPLALRVVYQVAKEIGIPIIGCGGIMKLEDAVEFFMAGASAIQLGTANLSNPLAAKHILEQLLTYLNQNNISDIRELRIW